MGIGTSPGGIGDEMKAVVVMVVLMLMRRLCISTCVSCQGLGVTEEDGVTKAGGGGSW